MKKIATIIFLMYFVTSNGQNLVINPDFEDYTFRFWGAFPKGWSDDGWIHNAIYINHRVNDSLKAINKKISENPKSNIIEFPIIDSSKFPYLLSKTVYSGDGMILVNFIDSMGFPCLTGSLRKGLNAGKKYRISFQILYDNHSLLCISSIGIKFDYGFSIVSHNYDLVFNSYYKRKIKSDVIIKTGSLLNDSINWQLMTADIVAKGGEDRVVLGCFYYDNPSLKKLNRCKGKIKIVKKRFANDKDICINDNNIKYLSASYFIDDVKIEQIK